jgi:ATP-dependent 26S proteasome regulatory subunit
VQFPFPGPEERREIWRRIFPEALPTANLSVEKLARLNVAGGNIRNIAINAAFGAARDSTAVTMAHILAAARGEYLKIEKTLPGAEVEAWT